MAVAGVSATVTVANTLEGHRYLEVDGVAGATEFDSGRPLVVVGS